MAVNQERLMYEAGKAVFRYVPAGTKALLFGGGRTVEAAIEACVREGYYKKNSNTKFLCGSAGAREVAKRLGLPLTDRTALPGDCCVCIDGADQVDSYGSLLKGGPKIMGAGVYACLGRPEKEGCMKDEKALSALADTFIVIVDYLKMVKRLGQNEYPLAVEVRPDYEPELRKMLIPMFGKGGVETRRVTSSGEIFLTTKGNRILDVQLSILKEPNLSTLEETLESWSYVESTGLFAKRLPDKVVVAYPNKIEVLEPRADQRMRLLGSMKISE